MHILFVMVIIILSIIDASIVYSRGGLSVNTTVSTVYFAKNAESMFELRSVATDAQLPLVVNKNNTDISSCTLDIMQISTMHSGWEEVSLDGFSLTSYNGKGYIQVQLNTQCGQPYCHIFHCMHTIFR